MMNTHFRCMSCNIIGTVAERVNSQWTGWDSSGLVKVDNWCCYDCLSNDLVYVKAENVDRLQAIIDSRATT